ncbi:MAG: radical SAM protein [archaeon]
MELKAARIAKWAKGKPRPPVRIEMHPTNRCNLKCLFCWRSAEKNPDYSLELPDEKLYAIVNEAAGMGVKEWIISGGGEPMVRKTATLRVLRLIKQHGMWGQLTTNGALFSELDAKTVVEIGWDQLQISLDAPDAKTHDYLRTVEGTFERATRTAGWLSKYKRELGSKEPYLGFNSIITRFSYGRMDDMIRLAHDVGFQLVYFEPVYGGYLSGVRLELNEQETEELPRHAKRAKQLADRLGVATNADRFVRSELVDKSSFDHVVLRETEKSGNPFIAAPCYQPWYLMGIKGCGLAGCCSTFEVGERVQDKTLADIWYGDLFNRMRQEMLSKELPDYCKKCSVVVVMDNKEIRKLLKKKLSTLGILRH